MSPQQIDELRKKAENYLERAAEAVDPQDQRLWLGLARDCLTLVSDARSLSDLRGSAGALGLGWLDCASPPWFTAMLRPRQNSSTPQ